MTGAALALALAAAVIHAGWNLALARQTDTEAATAIAMAVGVLAFVPVTILTWNFSREAIPFIAVTAVLQLVYFAGLATAYRLAELSVVYPIARGVAPVIVLAVGAGLLDETTSLRQVVGVLLIGAGVLLVRGLTRLRDAHGVLLGLAIASVIAAYTLVDARGVDHAGPLTYLTLAMVPASAAYLGYVVSRGGVERVREAVSPTTLLAGVASYLAYVLVLAALQRAPAAAVAAVRETSIVVATALAARILHERVSRVRLAGAVIVVIGVALVS
ncbi:MAG: EamA family transporter [Gaiellales bacterium]